MEFKKFEDENVTKFVFTGKDFVAESVLYKYGDYRKRTVICCSTQSGCMVGCKFCGTGSRFIRNLTPNEIVNQIKTVLKSENMEDVNSSSERFQIMFMSMGEPMHNWDSVELAIKTLNRLYPNAELLLSTIGVKDLEVIDKIINLSRNIDKIGLQFSIHKSRDIDRDKLIPFEDKLSLREIRDFGIIWNKATNRPVYLNYCIDGSNNKESDIKELKNLFSAVCFNFTFSVICSKDEDNLECGFYDLDSIREFEHKFIEDGYNTRVFNPDGQDTIGGGCGQLWYTQEWMNK